jgi:hypothetical protein
VRLSAPLVANISKLFWSLEKPSLARVLLLVARRWVDQTVQCLARHLSCLRGPLVTRTDLLCPVGVQRGNDRLAMIAHDIRSVVGVLAHCRQHVKIIFCVFSQVGHHSREKRCSVSMRRPCLPYLRLCSWGPNTGNPA